MLKQRRGGQTGEGRRHKSSSGSEDASPEETRWNVPNRSHACQQQHSNVACMGRQVPYKGQLLKIMRLYNNTEQLAVSPITHKLR